MVAFTWTGGNSSDWNDAGNWLNGLVPATVPPNDASATVTDDDQPTAISAIISGGSTDVVDSLTVSSQGHVIVGGSDALGGTGTGTLSAGTILVTSTNTGGGLVGGPLATVTATTLTEGVGAVIGGGGTFNIANFINNGIIQADGSTYGLGGLVITGGSITGTGSIEIDAASTLELGSSTAQTVLVNVTATPTLEVATLILDNPSSFTGTVDLFNPNSHLNLTLEGITADVAVRQGTSLVLIEGTTTVATVQLADNFTGEGFVLTGSTVAIAPTSIVAAAPTVTTVSGIINDATPMIVGTADAGSAVTLLSNGVAIGSATADPTTGAFTVVPSTPLTLGMNSLTATETIGGTTSGLSAPVNMFDVQAPVNGISTTDFSSAVLGAALGQGASLAFISGTEAIVLTDSTLSVGPDTNEATLQRLYQGLLGRSSDAAGIGYFDSMLTAGASKATVATDLLNSAEYGTLHGSPTDQQFVANLYQDMLGRTPGPDEAAYWNGAFAQGASQGEVAVSIADSAEAKVHLAPMTAQVYVPNPAGTLAHELYETGLGREVETAALPYYQAAYMTQTPSQIAASIASSSEFASDHAAQSNADYVAGLYPLGLGRAADPGGSAYWTAQLDNGGARSDVLLGIATSSEAGAFLTHNLSA